MCAVEIRRLCGDEWSLLKTLRLRALRKSPEAFWETADEAGAHADSYWMSLAQKLASPDGSRVFLLDVDGSIEGMVFGTKKEGGEYRVGGLWVDSSLRGKGYGTRLVQSVVDWARATPDAVIQLWCHMGAQTHFYHRNGFRSLSRYRTHESDGRQIVEMQWAAKED